MGYCTTTEVDNIIAQSLTSATDPVNQTRRNLLNIGSVRDKNVISDDIVQQFIRWSGQEIDAALSELYSTPLCELADFETTLAADIDEYNLYVILDKVAPLAVGDVILLADGDVSEKNEISEVVGDGVFEVAIPFDYEYSAGTRVLRLKYPDPIPWICSRLAAANIYDKYFASQASTNVSEYGDSLRKQARQKINDILNGRTILHGVRRIGRRLYDPTITDQYGLPDGSPATKDTDQLK